MHYLFSILVVLFIGGLFYYVFFLDGVVISYDRYDQADTEAAAETNEVALPKHVVPPTPVRAIYMTSWVGGTKDWRAELVQFVERTELNAIVIDIKDYSGMVSFITGDEVIKRIGSEEERISDMQAFIHELHSKNIYVIARITAFQDPHYSKLFPDDAIKDSRGGLWKDKNGLTYVDPLARDFWDYLVRVARAAEAVGFDELNFDYIRYPSDGPIQYAVYPYTKNGIAKADVIEEFFQYINHELDSVPVPLSADLFGFTTYYENDLNIGQILERADPYFDYLSPMVYPSHYPDGFNGYANPAKHPYDIIRLSMTRGMERLMNASSTPEKLRPWIQDFDLGATYDEYMVREEKRAVYDVGLDSWMAWDPANRYTRSAYDPAN
ncbi:MAG: hypothetical protein A3A17_04135 [Candidatus Ryanbacteria bacterium RIFCSPLOWO2_01_FULL_44_230]|nr:MAG: hypothetical protein A3A17_04135 [Candidatus Ryanbacteria bacterium RIFCSPLOWO2_01_FULL_44_230]OGZ55888.1 MAG: hypothetical protein A3F85_00790 [Candidatus Ryanbacteria bacterium RIFCSPLOWO2_12_FULL_44_26]